MNDVEHTQDEEQIITDSEQQNATEEEVFDWKAEALKHKAIADRLKKKLSTQSLQTKPEQKIDDDIKKDISFLKEVEAKRQFGFENNLSPQETDLAFKFAGGKPDAKVLEDEFFKAGIEGLRSKQRLENNIPGSSSRSSVFSEKPFEEMKEDERKNAFESKMKGIKK